MALYLDPLTRDTGCLRVIPGSHSPGDKFAESVHKGSAASATRDRSEEHWGIGGSEVPALALEVEPGDLLMFDQRIKHASFGGSTRRRGFMYAFEARYEEADLWVLREYMESHNEERYCEKMIGTVSPAGMRHLEQKLAVAEAMRSSVAGVESS